MIKQHKIIKKAYTIGVCLLLLFLTACKEKNQYQEQDALSVIENNYKAQISLCISSLDSLMQTENKQERLGFFLMARNAFKQMEPILSFVDKNNYKSLNQPNILKVEEEDATDIKMNKPFGFQVIEEQLNDNTIAPETLLQTVKLTKNRLGLILNNTKLKLKDYHVLWLLRDAIVRVGLTGITGFDSPVLERSLEESILVYQSIDHLLKTYSSNFTNPELLKEWQVQIKKTFTALDSDFNDFDRYNFIKNHTHKQLELILRTKNDWQAEFPFEMAFNNDMVSLFSNETFNIDYLSDYKNSKDFKAEKIALGKQLFNDKRLSINNDMSCASCHHEDKAFTDGLKTFPKQTRNSPTLAYAALQQSFFYDGRAGSLEGQVAAVVKNKNEFHSDLETMKQAVESDSLYLTAFHKIYKDEPNNSTIRQAIASYVRTLGSFNSKFDNNINNKENSLTTSEINGFNLFMGKAKCATCHFAPVFNGTVPPNFTETEFELLGVPEDTLKTTKVSKDLGRFHLFQTENRKHFFKTSTIRNISKTAPYMHNGVFTALEQVMEFYNNGGGTGLGFDLEYQTLPSDTLNLSAQEITDVIHFMKTLEDS